METKISIHVMANFNFVCSLFFFFFRILKVGHDGFSRMVATVRDALSDYHCEIHSMVVESNKAFCRLRFTGKHTGNLLGFPPTGRSVAWMGASEFTCKNGKILKVWELGDLKSLEEQLKSGSGGVPKAKQQRQRPSTDDG
jgi:predicted ester cyclase